MIISREKPLNILFITDSDVSSFNDGIDRVVNILTEELKKKPQYQVFSAYFETKNTPVDIFQQKIKIDKENLVSSLSDFIRENKIEIILNNVAEFKKLKFLNPALQQVAKQDHVCKILFHFHNVPGFERAGIHPKMCWSRLINDQCKLKFIYDFILQLTLSLIGKKIESFWVRKYRFIYQSVDKVVLLSYGYIPVFANCAKVSIDEKLIAINNPLSFSNSLSINQVCRKQKEVLIVARLYEKQKCISLALKIWKKIESNPLLSDWKLTILGDGEDKTYYQVLVRKFELKRVFFEGSQVPNAYYERASIFVMTSAFEGFPMTLIEAQQNGVVPIAFDSFGALHDIIENESNGLIIQNNDIEKYAKQLMWLMQHDEERQIMANTAIESSKRFHPSEIIKEWINLFEELRSQ